ncbi:MAG: PP2C family protein-serine/threonine phosphatase [Acidimicrobiales bacterium]
MTRDEQEQPVNRGGEPIRNPLAALLAGTTGLPASELASAVDLAGRVIGADSARMLIADYGLRSLQELGEDGPTGPRQPIEGTLAGRSFARDEIVVSAGQPSSVWVPLTEGSERLGVLELTHGSWSDDVERLLAPVVRVLVLVLVSKRRYTDVVLQSRRSEPLSMAAEMQWTLLPPLTCSAEGVSVSGILEPAYSIGGDSFDYAFNANRVDFAIVDAMGHGMSAVMLSVLAINGLRNARREGSGLSAGYRATDAAIREHYAPPAFTTAQFGSLTIDTGVLTWVNAGHPLPMLVRDGSFVGELSCRASLPLGLGGSIGEIATESLQPGDRVLFYTDGVIEARSVEGKSFGMSRLADLLVRATLDKTFPAETVRRLSSSIMAHSMSGLTDDATLFLIDYAGNG